MYRKGYIFERELKIKLEKEGWYVIRSGGSKKPDIIAAKNGKIIVIECKSSKDKKVYIEEEEVENLRKVAENFRADCVFAVKKTNGGVHLINLNSIKKVGKFYLIDLT